MQFGVQPVTVIRLYYYALHIQHLLENLIVYLYFNLANSTFGFTFPASFINCYFLRFVDDVKKELSRS